MFKTLLNFLAGGTVEQVGEYFREKQKLKHELKLVELKGKAALIEAKYKARAMQAEQVHSWEMAQLSNSGHKDEVVLFVVLFPYVGSFVPVIQNYILVGFQYLGQMPYWAVGLTVTICLAIYGIRHRNASKINAPGLRNKDVESEE